MRVPDRGEDVPLLLPASFRGGRTGVQVAMEGLADLEDFLVEVVSVADDYENGLFHVKIWKDDFE